LTCTYPSYGCLSSGIQGFNAVTGFDDVTGWGSPNGPSVFNALAPTSTNSNFTLSSSPSILPLTPGNGGTSSISLSALNGFSAAVNLTVVIPGASSNSAPAGLSATLGASSISAGGGPVKLMISTTSATPGGTYVMAVVGTSGSGCSGGAGGCLTQTAYVTVALPAFVGLSATPAPGVLLNQGSTATSTITISGINGFNSPVSLTASGLPSGVTASFGAVTSGTSTLTLSASTTAALTLATKPYAITVTGTATGSNPQSTVVNVFVNPPTTGGSGTPVNLSADYNIYAFYADASESSITAANSLDGVGFVYSADLLQSGLDFNGTQFSFGPPDQPDSISGSAPIALPTGYYTSLQMLATGVQGNQASQSITVTYTDTTTSQFTQSFSDWCSALNGGCSSTGSNPGESVAVAMPYRDSAGGPDNRVFYLYGYSFALNQNKTVQSLTLPNDRDVIVLAVSLVGQVPTGYTLSASPSTLSLPVGNSKTSTITVNPTGGFTGTVSFTASGLPNGVTALFTSTSATTSTLTLTASSSATTGPATITVTGTSGALTQTTMINLTVTASPSYSISAGAANPASVSPGGSSSATITVTPANSYTGTVTLSCSILPVVTGADAPTCSFGNTSPVSITNGSNTATMTFNTVPASTAMNLTNTLYAMWVTVPGLALIGLGFGSASLRRRKLRGVMLFGVILCGLIASSGCGGGSGSGGGGGNPGTPAGSYTVTITGKDATGLTQSNTSPVTVAITVN
jgi:hypothetical protein